MSAVGQSASPSLLSTGANASVFSRAAAVVAASRKHDPPDPPAPRRAGGDRVRAVARPDQQAPLKSADGPPRSEIAESQRVSPARPPAAVEFDPATLLAEQNQKIADMVEQFKATQERLAAMVSKVIAADPRSAPARSVLNAKIEGRSATNLYSSAAAAARGSQPGGAASLFDRHGAPEPTNPDDEISTASGALNVVL